MPQPPVPTRMTVPTQAPASDAATPGAQGWQGQPDQDTHVGPQFPDLFQKALQGSHLADNVTVHSMDDNSFASSAAGSGSSVGSSSGGGNSKKRWRKGR